MEVSTNTDLLHLTIRMPPKTAYEKISLKDISLDNIYLNDLVSILYILSTFFLNKEIFFSIFYIED